MGKQRLSDGIDVHYGEYAISGTTVIDSNRNLTNIGTITTTGAIVSTNSTNRLDALSIGDDVDIYLYESSTNTFTIRTGTSGAYKYYTFGSGGDFNILGGGLDISSTQVITSARALQNITTITASGDMAIDTDTLFVDVSTDRVGINTSAPDHALDVEGNIGLSEYIYHNGDHNTYFRFQGDQITLRTGGGDRLHLSNSGVLVNNAYTLPTADGSANQVMQTDGSGNVSFATLSSSFSGGTITDSLTISSTGFREFKVDQTDSGLIRMGVSSSTAEGFIIAGNTGTNHVSTAPAIKFMLDVDGGSLTEMMRVTTTGVGIGTTSPSHKLDIHSATSTAASVRILGDSAASELVIQTTTNNSNCTVKFGDTDDNDVGYIQYNHGSNYLRFGTSATERIRIDASGNLQMGSSPQTVIDSSRNLVNIGAITASTNTTLGGIKLTGNNAPVVQVTNGQTTSIARMMAQTTYSSVGTASNHPLQLRTNDTTALTIDTSQNATFEGNITATGNSFIDLNASGNNPAIKFESGANIYGAVSAGDGRLVIRGLNQLRFQDGNDYNYNKWAGIKYESSNEVLHIGGPAGDVFTNNSSPPNIDIKFNGVDNLYHNSTVFLDSSRNLTNIGTISTSGRIQIGTSASGDSSIISQSGDIQLRIGSISIQHNPFIRLQGNNGSNNVYGDIKLDTTNQKLVFNDPGTSSGNIGQSPMTLDNSGNLSVSGAITSSGKITSTTGDAFYGLSTGLGLELGVNGSKAGAIKLHGTTANNYALIQATTNNLHIDAVANGMYLNWYDGEFVLIGAGNGSTERFRFTSTGNFQVGGQTVIDASRNITTSGTVTISSAGAKNALVLSGTSPTMAFTDTTSGHDNFWIHVNSNKFYILPDRDGSTGAYGQWETPYALELDSSTNVGQCFGNDILVDGANISVGTISSGAHTITTAANGLIFPSSHSEDKIRLYDGGTEKIGTASGVLVLTGNTINFKKVGGTPNLQLNGTTWLDSSRNLTNIGTISATSFTVNASTTAMNSTTTSINSSNIVVGNNNTDDVNIGQDAGMRINDGVRGFKKNYADSSAWVKDTNGFSSQGGYYGGNFTVNGASTENATDYGVTPDGSQALLWTATGDTTNDGDGGWNKSISGVRDDSTYMSVVYVRRNGSSATGRFYHGCSGSHTANISDGSANTNPYFSVVYLTNLPQDVWCVSIAYIRANNNTSTAQDTIGGVYRCDTGERLHDATTYKMKDGSTQQQHRVYLYYSTSGSDSLSWYKPGFYEVNGTEPTFRELLYPGHGGMELHGNLRLDGDPTSSSQGRMIDFTGFDKESTSDFTDRAYIQHATNTGGHSGSVLVLSSQNDANDGIAFLTNSNLKHNSNTIWTSGNDGSGSGLDADNLDGYTWGDVRTNIDLSADSDTATRYLHLPRGGGITFYGDTNQHHGIFSRNNSNNTADDIMISSYNRIYFDLDSNNNNTNTEFSIGTHNGSNSIFALNGENAHLTIGADNMTPQLDLLFDDHASGAGWDTRIQIGKTNDIVGGTGVFPTYVSADGFGMNVQGNSDGVFYGMEKYGASTNYRPVIAWGDDTTDSPFFYRFNGTAEFAFTYNGVFHADDDIIAFSTTTSDARYKDNVSTIENALEKVQKIRGVEFDWNATSRKGEHDIGFIAQEIEQVIPEVVSEQEMLVGEFEGKDEKAKTVAYGQVTALLVEAIKEQQKEIEQLKKHSHPAKDMCDMKGYEELVARIEKMEKNYGNN